MMLLIQVLMSLLEHLHVHTLRFGLVFVVTINVRFSLGQ